MVVTNIGLTTHISFVADSSDGATGSGYTIRLPAISIQEDWPMDYVPNTHVAAKGGATTGAKAFIRNMKWSVKGVIIDNDTDMQNLKKALFTWDKDTTLYLMWKIAEFTNNIAVVGSYAAPTTLVQATVKMRNMRLVQIGPKGVQFSCDLDFWDPTA